GVCYERLPRFGGGAYHSILRRLESFTDDSLKVAIKEHEKHATMVLDLEEKVTAAVKKLKERGLMSPYLRAFVVARINPLRWIKGDPPPLEEVLKTMRDRAAKFNVEKIKQQDLAGAAGPPDDEGRRREIPQREPTEVPGHPRAVMKQSTFPWHLARLSERQIDAHPPE